MENILSLSLLTRIPRVPRRRRNALLACCALCAGGYVSYRVYTSPYLARRRRQVYRFFQSLSSLLDSAAQGSDCVGVLWKDLHSFLLSNEDEVPATLKQLFKVGQSREFQMSVALLCKSVTRGVVSSLSVNGAAVQDESDYGAALSEEMLSKKDGALNIGKAGGGGLGYKESRDDRHSRKGRRWRSLEEGDGMQVTKDTTIEGDYNSSSRRDKLHRSESTSRNDGCGEDDPEEDEGAGRYSSASRSYCSAEGNSWTAGTPVPSEPVAGWDGEGARRGFVEGKGEGLSERLVGKFFSEAGKGFASAVVASATRSLVLSVLEGIQDTKNEASRLEGWGSDDLVAAGRKGLQQKGVQMQKYGFGDKADNSSPPSSTFGDGVITFLCSAEGKSLIGDWIETFTGTAVSIYLDKTRDVNVYEDVLSTVSKPEHREPVKELLTSACNGAVETLIRISHEVLSEGAPGPELSEPKSEFGSPRESVLSLGKSAFFNDLLPTDLGESAEFGRSQGAIEHSNSASPPPRTPDIQEGESVSTSGLKRIAFDHSPPQRMKILTQGLDRVEALLLPPSTSRQINGKPVVLSNKGKGPEGSQGWIDGVSRTLAVPSNRALVLDVAGTVTAEAVRSAIDVVTSKLSLAIRGKKKVNELPSEGQPCTSKVLHVMNKTGEFAQATAAKAMVAVTMCLAICLHTLVGPSKVVQLS